MKVVVSWKPGSNLAKNLTDKIIEELKSRGIKYCIFPRCSPCEADGLIVIGGDGTLLYTLSSAYCETPPILTIRAGRRAFLLDTDPSEVKEALDRFLAGEYWAERHRRLRVNDYYAVNEVAILTKGRRVTKVDIKTEDTWVYKGLEGDGVIVSTTLGSTAYALSAGGPLVDPRAEVILLVPVNPIHLNVRSVVFPPSLKLYVSVEYPKDEVLVLIDGVRELHEEEMEISLDGPSVIFARMKPRKFYEKLIELRSLLPQGTMD
ncbi:NAD+ kinase [Ignicoccus pacificus DSM 13166]|uniref:NAD kinase n=1 Tax=Ignicoccus pacificus DSM 13166 TaxID=940294 RepID=A0A977PK17_9CREN|nr:NAD+ kinase [Ignicoccus pacificus DSM 13166]